MKVLILLIIILISILSIFLITRERFENSNDNDCEKCRDCMRKHPGLGTINLQAYGCYDIDTCSMCGTPEDIQGNIVNAIYSPPKN